jgi:alcohol dehydrogenase class-P
MMYVLDRPTFCLFFFNLIINLNWNHENPGRGVAVLVGVPHKEAVFKTHPMNFLNERTLKGTFFGNYKPRTDLPNVVEMHMTKVL